MDPVTAKLMSAAGAAEERIYVDDVFSTFLHTGTGGFYGSAQAINNGIDLSGEGGLVWVKNRDSAQKHILQDTARGTGQYLSSNETGGNGNAGTVRVSAFNSNGFTVGTDDDVNKSGEDHCSWTFRKCPGFFDVVTWTGDGTNNRAISHNLGHNIRALFIKSTSSSGDWAGAYLQGASLWTGDSYTGMYLNKTDARGGTTANGLGVSAISTTTFTVNASGSSTTLEFVPNANGVTYVAYLFSDQAAFGDGSDEKILEIGTYSGTGSAGHEINLGFETQWVMVKRMNGGTGNWEIADIMRGQPVSTGSTDGNFLRANSSNNESTNYPIHPNSTGFTIQNFGGGTNASGSSYWYMAIRRPHKPPTDADDVFDIDTFSGSGSAEVISTTFTVDANLTAWRNRSYWPTLIDRLRGGPKEIYTENANSEYTNNTPAKFDFQTGLRLYDYSGDSGYNLVSYSFKRAPEFFDVVAYTGNNTNFRDVTHNLSVTPEMIWVKNRDRASDWIVWHKDFSSAADSYANLNLGANVGASTDMWGDGLHTSTTFELGLQNSVNRSGEGHVAFLFASKAGISKVGTYSGTGNNVNVDCGFTAGARFVLIKRTDATGDWYVWDTARGIVSGNDEYLLLNEGGDNTVTNTDYIDPLNSGFTVTSSAPAALNASGGNYIFLAIA